MSFPVTAVLVGALMAVFGALTLWQWSRGTAGFFGLWLSLRRRDGNT